MSSTVVRFTATQLQALRPGPKQRDITDPGTRGLVLRVERNGTKYWLFRYKWAGEPIRLVLGAFPSTPLHEARRIAQERQDLLRRRIDPRKAARPERRPSQNTAARKAPVTARPVSPQMYRE